MTDSPNGGPLSSDAVRHAPPSRSDWLPRPYAAPDYEDSSDPDPSESSPGVDLRAQARMDVVRARIDEMMDTPVVSR